MNRELFIVFSPERYYILLNMNGSKIIIIIIYYYCYFKYSMVPAIATVVLDVRIFF